MNAPATLAADGRGRLGARQRSTWRTVGLPSEHGGWGLTLEPVLLGLLVAPSWPGVAIGLVALAAFLARTPSKLVLVDLVRHRWLPRTTRAATLAGVEVAMMLVLAARVVMVAGWALVLPILLVAPLLLVELWYDARSRGRRLIPELAGAVGIAATATAIVVADERSWRLGFALWAVLAGRALVSIPFIRSQILRLRRGSPMSSSSMALQGLGVLVAIAAGAVEHSVFVGTIGVVAIAALQAMSGRRAVPPPKVLGIRQLAFGLALSTVTAAGVHLVG
ncbi:MAG: YwiC-like family protein [Ilumatobacter sp.]|nr:YwiC-like family protein [Ilumatobacter sp.]